MVAGASGIDHALLLVAADEGPMPQTREHLAVLSLLGVERGAVVITKCDRALPERIEALQAEVRQMLAGTRLDGSPVFAVSALTGDGVDTLRAHLFEAARALEQHAGAAPDPRAFRLAIDRAFSLPGAGTVVTGTIHAGRVRVGDELALTPAPRGNERRARVRSLHAQNQAVQEAWAGQRCAVALVGLGRDEVERGQWLTHPALAFASSRFDARLTLWHGESRPLVSGTHVQLHLGAERVNATVALLDAPSLAPGASALVQLVCARPIGAWHGERLLLRDAAASRTLAGGVVLDPHAPTRYRRTSQRLAELAALEAPDLGARLRGLLLAAPHGLDLQRFGAGQGLQALPSDTLPSEVLTDGSPQGAARWAIDAGHAATLEQQVLEALARFHERQPDELGPDSARLRRLAVPRLAAALWQALLAQLASSGAVMLHGPVVHRPEHGVQLSATELRIAQKAAPLLATAGYQGAWARDLARDSGEPEPLVRTTLARLARRGELHQIVKDLFFAPEVVQRLAELTRQIAAERDGAVRAAELRDATNLGRKRAIQILEYFDRVGLTRRVGDAHLLRADTELFQPGSRS
jgi:selenocysteine-specific elongation factor